MRLFSLLYLLPTLIVAEDKIRQINLPNIPSRNLLSVTSDGSSFIWAGSDQGLVRYDGIDVDIFRSNPFSSISLSGNRVWFLDNYNADTLIAVTDNAIHLYSKKNYEFEKFKINSRPTNYFKIDNEIWITTLSDGVYKLNKNKDLIWYKFEPLNPFSISSSNFESINGNKFALDSNGDVWLATSSGLNKIQRDNSVRRYFRSNTDNKLLSENILSLYYLDSETLLVGTDRGLVVPVLRETDEMSFADIEKNISDLGQKARDGKITIEDLQGGTFTVTNGGIYGSMLSTPILNPPQSAVLGMHNIVQRPVVVNGSIEARPVMYLALSYDHRVVDGKEAVSFLKNIKDFLEEPKRLFLNI